jgi:hypothetical protein
MSCLLVLEVYLNLGLLGPGKMVAILWALRGYAIVQFTPGLPVKGVL